MDFAGTFSIVNYFLSVHFAWRLKACPTTSGHALIMDLQGLQLHSPRETLRRGPVKGGASGKASWVDKIIYCTKVRERYSAMASEAGQAGNSNKFWERGQ